MQYGAGVRIFLGFVWIVNGGLKLANPTFAVPGGQCERWLRQFTAHTSGPYHDFVTNFVIPHVSLFAFLVEWGESLVGIALILGIFTTFSASMSIFLLVNYWVMRGAYSSIGGYADIEPDLTALAVVVLAWPATRHLSLDEFLERRIPASRRSHNS
jgi:uncharacterized membrane protein YphA (DoxX/SURF4 family)